MKFLRKEFIRNLLTHWRYNLLIFFALSVVVLIGYIVLFNLFILQFKSVSYSSRFGDKNYYYLYMSEEDFNMMVENAALKKSGAEVKEQIFSSPLWDAYDYFGDAFFLDYDENGNKQLPDIFENGYEEGETFNSSYPYQYFKAIAVSQEAIDIYDMSVSEGRLFSDEDYFLEEEHGYSTAVLLGSAYRDYFNVGDIIVGDGFNPERNITVVGFLEEGTLFGKVDCIELFPLDRYILFPIHNHEIKRDGSVTGNPWVEDYNVSHFTNIVSKHNNQTVQNELDRITNAYGFPAVMCKQWGGSQIESTAIVSRRNVWLLTGLAVLLVSIAIVSMAFVLNKKTEKNMPTYAVYMLNGIRPRMIFLAIASEALLLSLLSVLPAIWISFLQFGELYTTIRYVFYISVPVMILSLIPACRLIQKINLDQLARRKSE